MADPTAPDYYDQVTLEVQEALKADDKKIADRVWKLTDRSFESLRRCLEDEFGRAAVRNANLHEFIGLLHDVASQGADIGKGVVIDRHHTEAQKSAGSMLQAVMAGMDLAQGKGNSNDASS